MVACAGPYASELASNVEASVTTDALYTALAHDEQCKILLKGMYSTNGGNKTAGFRHMNHGDIRKLGGPLTAQLNAFACLARMCTQV